MRSSNPGWFEAFGQTVARWRDAGLGSKCVVAVSGGGDSVALLRALCAWAPEAGLDLSVAHLDHGVRGEAARADAAFVRAISEESGLACDLGRWEPSGTSGFEAQARSARYEWLQEVARARGASVIAVGHTRDDQAETTLHRIVRGTGMRGLGGMPARRRLAEGLTLVRPLLGVSRADLRAYLTALGQPFCEDATNADLGQTRARMRHDLLPKLAAEYNPRVVDALIRLGTLSKASHRTLRHGLRRLAGSALVEAGPERLCFDQKVLRRLPSLSRTELLRAAWRDAGWPQGQMGAQRWRLLASVAASDQARVCVGQGVVATASCGRLVLERRLGAAQDQGLRPAAGPVPLPVPGAVQWAQGRLVATLEPPEPRDETIDLDRLQLPLSLRGPRPGDRFEPLGMGGAGMALNDFFRGRRVARGKRPLVPLVCDQEGIVWVVGHRIADRVRIGGDTRRSLGLRWEFGTHGSQGG